MDLQEDVYGDEESDEFRTMKESDIDEQDQQLYGDGDVLEENAFIENDSVCQLSLVHQDHVYCVTQVPRAPFNTFVSGDGNDKCYIWSIRPV